MLACQDAAKDSMLTSLTRPGTAKFIPESFPAIAVRLRQCHPQLQRRLLDEESGQADAGQAPGNLANQG